MSVGLLIVTHGGIGDALLETATSMLQTCPLRTEVLGIAQDSEPADVVRRARHTAESLDEGQGVLVLTDMYGSTPSNIAAALAGEQVRVIAGVNLPMLVRVLNYPGLGLAEMTEKALSGGHDGVFAVDLQGVS